MSVAALPAARAPAAAHRLCAHCGQPSAGANFCCAGCAAAHEAIERLGLGAYYRSRVLDPASRPPRPEATAPRDLTRFVHAAEGVQELVLAVDGLQCGACVWLIESVLAREPGLLAGRINLTTRRLRLAWRGEAARAGALVARIEALGYRLAPFDPAALAAAEDREGRALVRALAVAGFAAGNVMLLSIGTWAGLTQNMGPATRTLMHWVSAVIAVPAIAYAGMPFFRHAWSALGARRTNMDVPISIGVVLVTAMSLAETLQGGRHTYFDSAATLIFFLLVGRVLDHRARGRARATAQQWLMLRATEVTRLAPDGSLSRVAQDQVAEGERILVGMGERIGVDGVVEQGSAPLDASLVTGESLPVAAAPGSTVFAGTLNLGAPLTIRATATGGATLLAECVRLIEAAEGRRGRFVVLADRVARRYAPTVHLAAAATFLLWWGALGAGVGPALLTACAVLIITCPCALALAVPVVQVVATSGLLARGIMVKSPTALERLAEIDLVVFDKTGTLTEPLPALSLPAPGDAPGEAPDPAALAAAARLAAASRHPLARALVAAAGGAVAPAEGAVEHPGAGMACGAQRLGSRAFCGVAGEAAEGPELWFTRPGAAPVRFAFAERLRPDAAATLARLRGLGLEIHLLSGDGPAAVARIVGDLGLAAAESRVSPVGKAARIAAWRAAGRRVLMVGDGLNDGPALAEALVSISPASAADISQTVADAVFQGASLAPVAALVAEARRARRVMRQNLGFSLGYNALMLPLAVAGLVTPWLAAIAMSSSSVLVILNGLRLRRPEHGMPLRGPEHEMRLRRPEHGMPLRGPEHEVPLRGPEHEMPLRGGEER